MKRKVAIFTLVDRYNKMLDIWIDYYSSLFGKESICILFDPINKFDLEHYLYKKGLIDYVTIIPFGEGNNSKYERNPQKFNDIQKIILSYNDVVIYTDLDEIIFHPNLKQIIDTFQEPYITTIGFDLIHDYRKEKDLDFESKIIGNQRNYGVLDHWYDKPLILREYLDWDSGKHNKHTPKLNAHEVYLVHLNRMDFKTLLNLNIENKNNFTTLATHNSIDLEEGLKQFYEEFYFPNLVELPSIVKQLHI